MMTTQPSTRLYKVTFEQTKTNKVFYVIVEAPSAFLAGQSVLEGLGVGYELILVVGAKRGDFH
jgi:hypothetical protein